MQMKKIKEEKASVSVYVFIVLFTYLIILSSIYFTLISVNKAQLKTILKIKQSYELDNGNIEQIYQEKVNAATAGAQVKKPSTWTSQKVTAISDGKGGIVPLPDEYYYVGGDIDTGLVISDKAGDTMDASGTSMRKPVCVDTCNR